MMDAIPIAITLPLLLRSALSPRACGHSADRQERADEMNHRREALISFFVARGETPERLEFTEEVLDEMAPFVHLEVARDALGPVGLGWNDGCGASLVELGTQ